MLLQKAALGLPRGKWSYNKAIIWPFLALSTGFVVAVSVVSNVVSATVAIKKSDLIGLNLRNIFKEL